MVQAHIFVIGFTILSALPVFANSVWLECSGHLVGLNEANKTYIVNDDYVTDKGAGKVWGKWFQGSAIFRPHQVEFTITETLQNRGSSYILRNRLVISRVDLRYDRYFSKKKNDENWTIESAGFNPTGTCTVTKDPGIKNKI